VVLGIVLLFVLILGGGGTGASGSVTIETTDLPNIINQNVAGYAVATNGQIDFIEIVDGGTGYVDATTTVNINGDGEGAAAELTVVDGEITAVTITDRGQGYTFAELTINGDGTNGELQSCHFSTRRTWFQHSTRIVCYNSRHYSKYRRFPRRFLFGK